MHAQPSHPPPGSLPVLIVVSIGALLAVLLTFGTVAALVFAVGWLLGQIA